MGEFTKKIKKKTQIFDILLQLARIPILIPEVLKPVNPNGNQSWIFTGRTDVEAEVPVLWPPDAKSQLTGKEPDVGKDRKEGGGREGDG